MMEVRMGESIQIGDAQVDMIKLVYLSRHYDVMELSIFGSAVRGEMRPGSDIDIMVEFDPGARIGLLKFESLSEDLTALVGRKVDLVTKRGLKAWIRPTALQEARVIYAAWSLFLERHPAVTQAS
jgi:predicted nucleotidyltransferase